MEIWRKCDVLLGAAALLALGGCVDDSLRLSAASGGATGVAAPRDVARAAHDPMAIELLRGFAS
jgi:hypothetical protein